MLPSALETRSLRLAGQHDLYSLERALSTSRAVSVFTARSASSEQVIIKLAENASGIAAVEQESSVLSELQQPGHPGLTRLLDRGTRDELPWFAIERAGTTTLFDHLAERQTRSVDAASDHALSLISALSRALAYVHSRGFVHGDVNPRNIMLAGAEPTLIDFGSARAISTLSRGKSVASKTDTATPGYIAPERLLGEAWDSRSDVYALGCIWIELMTARPLFVAADVEALARRHLSSPIPSIHALEREIGPELVQLLSAMLAKDPHARPAHLEEVARAFERRLAIASPAPAFDAPLFESRLFGQSPVGSTLQRQLADTAEGLGGVSLIVGKPGSGRTRMLSEAITVAGRLGLKVLEPSTARATIEKTVSELGWLIPFDDADRQAPIWCELQTWATAKPALGRVLLLGTARDSSLAEPATRVVQLEPLSREASRRVVSDMLAYPVHEALQTLVWRSCSGNPGRTRELLRTLRGRGHLVRSGVWKLAPGSEEAASPSSNESPESHLERARSLAAAPSKDHERIAEHYSNAGDARRAFLHYLAAAAGAARGAMPDRVLTLRCLESAYVEIRSRAQQDHLSLRRTLRTGQRLLEALSKSADHNGVHALSRELLEVCSAQHELRQAQIRRLNALSYRIGGHHADALRELETARVALTQAPRARAIEREQILNRLGASWAHYSNHDGESSLRAVRCVASSVRRVGTPAQWAEMLLHGAKAIALKERYAFSKRVIRLERMAVAICEHHALPSSAAVYALSNLAFMLLWGAPEHCSEGVQIFEHRLARARAAHDITELTRVTTYLAIGYRRLRRDRECEEHARAALELSQDCGQPGYLGAAHACLGWVALRRSPSHSSDAKLDCERAVQVWQRRRATDDTRRTEYPFQWLGILPLLALAAAAGAAPPAHLLADLLHPTQARLEPPLQRVLERAAREGVAWDADGWEIWGDAVVRTATAQRYL